MIGERNKNREKIGMTKCFQALQQRGRLCRPAPKKNNGKMASAGFLTFIGVLNGPDNFFIGTGCNIL